LGEVRMSHVIPRKNKIPQSRSAGVLKKLR